MGGSQDVGSSARGQFQIYSLGGDGPVRWRLLGGNHRDLGRSVLEYADAESCRIGIKELLAGLDALVVTAVRAGGSWSWRLVAGREPIVAASHAFDRRIRCMHAGQLFLEVAAVADIRADVLVSSWRGYIKPRATERPSQFAGGSSSGHNGDSSVITLADVTAANTPDEVGR